MTRRKVLSLSKCTLSFLYLLATTATAHMEMKSPYALRSKFVPGRLSSNIDYSNTSPLSADGSEFPCKGYISGSSPDDSNERTPLEAGQSYNLQLAGSAFHLGGSCQISLSYDNGATFRVIKSVIGGCPTGPDASIDYSIPDYAPAGHAYLAWTWLNHEGNREFYMNCAYVDIENAAGGDEEKMSSQPGIWVANQKSVNNCKTKEARDPVFPNPGEQVEYGAGLNASSTPSDPACEFPAPQLRLADIMAGDIPSSSSVTASYTTIFEFDACPSNSVPVTVTNTSVITRTYCPSCQRTTMVTLPCDNTNSHTPPPTTTSEPPPPVDDLEAPYANAADFSPYLPCKPGSFICTDANTFYTCAITPYYSWTWQFPRQVAAGMACIPSLSPMDGGQAQQPGSPAGFVRADQYGRARPNGSCKNNGALGCLRDGTGFMICDNGGWVDMGSVADGTKCVDGAIVEA